MSCGKFRNSHFDIELSVFEKQTKQWLFDRPESLKPRIAWKFMLVFWFFTLSINEVFYSDIWKKKVHVMYWESYSKEFRYALKCRGKSFPFSKHVKMFYEGSKAHWRLCLCYNVYPTQTIPYRTGRLMKWIIKFLLKHTTFYKIRKSPASGWTSLLYFLVFWW